MARSSPGPLLAAMVLIVGLAAALASAPPSAAVGHHVYPVALEGGGPGTGWVALTVHNDGSPMRLWALSQAVDPPGHTGIYGINANGDYSGGAQVIIIGSMGDAVVDIHPAGDARVTHEVQTLDGPHYGGGVLSRYCDNGCPNPFTVRAVLLTAGDAQSWEWSVTGEGATVLAVEEGSGAVAMTGRDMDFGAHASAYAYGVGVRAEALREVSLQSESRALATFFQAPFGGSRLSAENPDGSLRACSCTFIGDPGRYGFQIMTGGGAGPTNFHETYLGFADIRLSPIK